MSIAKRLLILAITIAVCASVLLLAGSMAGAELQAGIGLPPRISDISSQLFTLDTPNSPVVRLPPEAWRVIRLTFWVMLPFSLIYALASRAARRRIIVQTLMMALTFYACILAIRAFANLRLLPSAESSALETIEEQYEELVFNADPPAALTTVLSVIFMVGVAALLYGLWRRFRPKPRPAPAPFDAIAIQASDALVALRLGEQLNDVILQCYSEMAATVAQSRGVRRADGMTAREFTAELTRIGLPAAAVERLTQLFETVRYGDYAPTRRDQSEAVDSLQIIAEACARLRQP